MNGNTLPIAGYREQIVTAVRESPAVVITAETGAGKSTQVPQYLLDAGYDIVVTQPRRIAARTVAARVACERGERLGETVGFRTAYERQDSAKTRCLFVTDGLALVRELMGAGHHTVLVLDEVHEWNLNMEVLVAWAKRQIEAGANFKVVLMSATLEAEKLAEFLGKAPIITVPGRLFPVEDQRPGSSLEADVEALLRAGRNVLVFQPGKKEIGETVSYLQKVEGLSAEVLPLHGDLEAAEQDRVFRHFGRPKCVVATNVAQTSITIDDIDAVVDAGLERRVELVEGVEGLYLKPISRADAAQRKGRAGRCKPGVYIDWCASSDRLDFPKAEVLRVRLDQTVLRLAEAGIDMEEMEFFHQPDKAEIHEAKRALKALGCMDGVGRVTPIGRQVARLPISVKMGRMVVEADRLGVMDDVIDLAAVLEQGEVTARLIREPGQPDREAGQVWRAKFCPTETESDVMAQLAVYQGSHNMGNDERRAAGVFVKAYHQAKEKRRHLAEALRGKVSSFKSTGRREDIIRCLIAGMVDHLYHLEYGSYRDETDQTRELARESVVRSAEWLVGFPWDLEIQTRRGKKTLRMIRLATKVTADLLLSAAPQAATEKNGLNPVYDSEKDCVVSTTQIFFDGQMIREVAVESPEHPEAAKVFAQWLAGQMV